MSWREGRHRQAAEIQCLLSVNAQDCVAPGEIAHRFQHADRMDIAVLNQLVGAGRGSFRCLSVRQLLAPSRVFVRIDSPLDALQQLTKHGLAVADDGDIDVAGGHRYFRRVDVDACDLRRWPETRGTGVTDDVVHTGAKHDDQVGILERAGPHRQEGIRVVIGHHATALRGGIERDAGGFDEGLHFRPGARPDHART